MLTPIFSITQDDDALWVTVRAPYANVKDTEIEYDGYSMLFSSKPYFLRLQLPCEVVDDETGTAEYNVDEGKELSFSVLRFSNVRESEQTHLYAVRSLMKTVVLVFGLKHSEV